MPRSSINAYYARNRRVRMQTSYMLAYQYESRKCRHKQLCISNYILASSRNIYTTSRGEYLTYDRIMYCDSYSCRSQHKCISRIRGRAQNYSQSRQKFYVILRPVTFCFQDSNYSRTSFTVLLGLTYSIQYEYMPCQLVVHQLLRARTSSRYTLSTDGAIKRL